MFKVFTFKPSLDRHETIRLCYIVQGKHCYPILNSNIIDAIYEES